jgi:hypothetical protein
MGIVPPNKLGRFFPNKSVNKQCVRNVSFACAVSHVNSKAQPLLKGSPQMKEDLHPQKPAEVKEESIAMASVQASVWPSVTSATVFRFLSTFGIAINTHNLIEARRKAQSSMLESLRAHRDTLQNFIVATSRDIPLETLSTGMGRALGNCLQILQDGVSALNSLIEYLDQK